MSKTQSIIKLIVMDKTYRTERSRIFLIEELPEPLTRAAAHIQFFDNYITETRLRLRSIRDPESKEWTYIMQQRLPVNAELPAERKISDIYLNEAEHAHFEQFEGNEIRKNRYFHEFDGRMFSFDVYLGKLWGLNTALVEFDDDEDPFAVDMPSFAVYEVTGKPFFSGENLVNMKFDDIQAEVAELFEITAEPNTATE